VIRQDIIFDSVSFCVEVVLSKSISVLRKKKKKKKEKKKLFPSSSWKGKGGRNLQILIHVLQLHYLLFSMQGKQRILYAKIDFYTKTHHAKLF